MGNLLTQSLKILKDATVLQGKDYMSNAVSLVNDANEVRTDVMKVSKNSVDTLKNLKRGFNFRMIHDWFYQKENEYSDADDEFDPGYDTGMDEEDNDSTVLDRDAMKSISKHQSNMMIQLGAKQAETTMASTAEIVTTLNQRSSEILSSVNNINSTLLGISKKLDAFASVVQAEKTEQAKMSLYDSQGRLSISSIYNMAKNSSGGMIGDLTMGAGMLPMLKGMGPAEVLQMAYGLSGIGNKNLSILGGHSIDETMEKINNSIGEAVQRGLEDLISSKPFVQLFGDLKRGEANHNYNDDVVKGFNNKQATFDGYVRTTIIKTIPEYLRVIAKGVTGINYNVGKDGALMQGTSTLSAEDRQRWERDEKANQTRYTQEMWGSLSKDSFRRSGVSWTGRDSLYQERPDKNLTRTEINMIVTTLNGVFVQLIGEQNANRLEPKMLTEDATLTETAITLTARIMRASSSKNNVDWMLVVRSIFNGIATGNDARNFCNGVNRTFQELHVKRTEFATSGSSYSSLAGKATQSQMIASAVKQNKNTYKQQQTLEDYDESKHKLDQFNKMSVAERMRPGNAEEIRKLKEHIKDLERIMRESGSGNVYNQSAYGNYLNIAKNGCGPVALADMLNRRGLYNPMTGMNVAGYMNASAMMGQPLTPGAVNNMSLRMASGNNPITLLGSGPEFGTAYGNNHFMNVIGTDGAGNVYVMNPIDGKVHKRSINGVAGSSVVGLYGTGIADRISSGFNNFMSRTGEEMYDSAKNRVSSYLSNKFANTSTFIDNSLQRSLERAQQYGESANISDEDRTQMNLVMSMMETSAEDGDSGPDKQAIMMEISRIKDQKLKARLRAAVGGMIDRSAKKNEKGGGILGKILSAGKGVLKNFFAPLIGGITAAIKTVAKGAAKFLSPVIKYFKRQLQKNLGKMGSGAKLMWEGTKQIFSRGDRAEGEERQPGLIGRAINRFRTSRTDAGSSTTPISTTTDDGMMPGIEVPTTEMPVAQTNQTGAPMMPSVDGTTPTSTNQTDNNKKDSFFNRLGKSIGDKLGGKLGGITKILGGMGGILSGMAGMLLNIFMGVNGFKALFKTVTTVVKSIAKSFNGLFKSLNKTLKPVLKILTKTLTEIVKSVTNIIAPVLEGLEPVLTTVGQVLSNILTPLEPILNGLGKFVGKLTDLLLTPIQMIADGIKWVTTKFARGMGKLLHPFSKKKRAQYYKDIGIPDDGFDEGSDPDKAAADAEYRKLSKQERAAIAERYAKIIHPVNKEKQADLYEKMVSGDVTEEDAKTLVKKKGEHTLMSGGAPVGGFMIGTKLGQLVGHRITDGESTQLALGPAGIPLLAKNITDKISGNNAANKEKRANELANQIYPNDSVKRGEIYDKIMAGEISEDDARAMITRKSTERISMRTDDQLAKEGVNATGAYIVKYLKGRNAEVDAANAKLEKKHDEERKEDQEIQKSIFKNGPLKILSGVKSLTDGIDFLKGGATSLFGIFESGAGNIIGGIGRGIVALGHAFALLPWVDENNKIATLGEALLETSDKMTADGTNQLTKGLNMMKRNGTDYIDSSAASITKTSNVSLSSSAAGSVSSKSSSNVYSIDRGNLQTRYFGGDIPYSNADTSIIGSGDIQSSFGNYLNMARRGCGPVALAEAYNRRTGSNINARNLAASMTATGTYSPSNGTSVGGYLSAARSLGMNTRVGGVTMNSLKRATPNNPITLVGSGAEFGTRKGNNHYLNAIGTDHYGGVYVSNPINGRIQRRSANSLAGSSIMGIYGSGDIDDIAGFSDTTKEAMSKLLSFSGIFGKLFQTDADSDIEELAESSAKADNEAKIAKTARDTYSDEDYQSKVLAAMEAYKGDNPIRDNETIEEYEKRISDTWNNNKSIQNKYIAMVTSASLNSDVAKQYSDLISNSSNYFQPYVEYQKDANGNILHDESGNPIIKGGFKYLTESEDSDYVKSRKASLAIKKLGEAIAAASAGGSSGVGGGGSASGGSNSGSTSDLYEAAAQVWEAMAKKAGGSLYSYGNHGPVTTRSGVTLNEIHPDCSGMISAAMNYMGYTFKGTMNGSKRRWTTHDISGKTSNSLIYNSDGSLSSDWEFIPYSPDKVREGDILTTPSHVGLYIQGNSANARGYDAGNGDRLPILGKGAAKAYLDRDSSWRDQLQWTMGPGYSGLTTILRYVGGNRLGSSFDDGGEATSGPSSGSVQGKIKLSKAMQNASPEWKHYPNKLTKGGYWDAAKKAGFTTAQTAMVAAIGIHENGAKKLTGEESLTRVVWDNIGKQYAFGLMNWIPDAKNSRSGANETKYGTTLADQLKYIRESYFSPTSTYDRAKNINFNRYYGNAMKEALGYAPHLGQGARWGPYAETDLAEAMGHYVGNALVPYDFARTSGQARHMRTAVEAYNWMLENGKTNGYATGSGGSVGSGASVAGFNLSSILGDYANDLPDYYKNLLGTVQTSIDTTAAAAASSYSDSYDDFGDYDYDDEGDAEVMEGDTRTYATSAERSNLYSTMKKKHTGSTAWSNTQLTSKGYGDVYLYLEPSTSAKIVCKLQNNKKYTKVTTSGSWYFVYARSGVLCGWGRMSDFALTTDVKNKSYQTNTTNSINSASDAMYAKWKGSSDSMMFYNPGDLQADADKKFWSANKRNHWYNSKNGVQSDINKYWKYEVKNSKRTKVADPYVMLNTSYDKSHVNVYQPFLLSKLKSKTLGQLKNTPGACGDFDFGTTDSGFYIPGNILGSGEDSINPIPPLDNNAYDALMDYSYNSDGSYTVNNYNIQGGINNATADLSRYELLNYLVKSEFTTRSPRIEKLLKKILDKLGDSSTTSTDTSPSSSDMYEDEIPEVIKNLVRG